MLKNITLVLISFLATSSSVFASAEGSKLCEDFVSKGTISNVRAISFPNSKASDYLHQFRKIKAVDLSESEKKDLDEIATLLKKTSANQKIFHAYNSFEKSAIPAEWGSLYPSLNLVLNEKAQKVFTVTDDEVNFSHLLKKPNPNVEYVLVDLSLVQESSEDAKMGQVMHTCYCYSYHLDASNALHCAYK